MESKTFALILTKGVHVIDAENARILNDAIENNKAMVNVSVDLHGDGLRQTAVRIATGHVVMIIPEDDTLTDIDFSTLGESLDTSSLDHPACVCGHEFQSHLGIARSSQCVERPCVCEKYANLASTHE
jgi:hypothetical protein